ATCDGRMVVPVADRAAIVCHKHQKPVSPDIRSGRYEPQTPMLPTSHRAHFPAVTGNRDLVPAALNTDRTNSDSAQILPGEVDFPGSFLLHYSSETCLSWKGLKEVGRHPIPLGKEELRLRCTLHKLCDEDRSLSQEAAP